LPARIADNQNVFAGPDRRQRQWCEHIMRRCDQHSIDVNGIEQVRKRLKGTDTLVERRHSAPRFGVRIGSRDQPELWERITASASAPP